MSSKLAKLIDEAIKEKGTYPEILKYLPAENLDQQSTRYFRHYVWLNTYTFISNENILNIGQNTEGVLAKYGEKEKLILMVVEYNNEQEAFAAKKKFNGAFFKNLKQERIIKVINGKYCGSDVEKNFFVGVFGGARETDVKKLITRVKESINRLMLTK